jgi:2-haloacid dehalogenase
MMPRVIVFDAYCTVFVVRALVLPEARRIDADLDALARLWRQRQLEHTWLLSLMGRYQDFGA